MMGIYFQYPFLLFFLPVILFIWSFFWYRQRKALKELESVVHPTKISKLTQLLQYKEGKGISWLKFRVFSFFSFIAVISLCIGFASPFQLGDSEVMSNQSNVFIAIDSSWSMRASDNQYFANEYPLKPNSRFGEGKVHAMALSKLLEHFSVGVITFAKNPVQHTFPHSDKKWVDTVLRQTNVHNIFSSGNDLKALMELLISTSRFSSQGFQVVLYSDGDIPEEEKNRALEFLPTFKRMDVPIHVVAIGSAKGQKATMSYNRLVSENIAPKSGGSDRAGQKYRATKNVVVQERVTQKDSIFLKKLAKETGGYFWETEMGESGLNRIQKEIESRKDKRQTLIWEATGRNDISYYFLIFPFLFFLYDTIWFRKGAKL
ncbi:MAG: VWA domain-containing protein [Leptospira sp.]|nr:VWA domain-containing protein [Leptospira sp.]